MRGEAKRKRRETSPGSRDTKISDFICGDLTPRTIIRRLFFAGGPAPLRHGCRRVAPFDEAFQHFKFSLIRKHESAEKDHGGPPH